MARFEKLSVLNNSKFEYVSPAITFNKDLPYFEDYGNINFTSNLRLGIMRLINIPVICKRF